MRSFFLEDENGERFSLMEKTSFLHEPDGLGFADDFSFETSNSGFFHVLDEETEQPDISGDVVFFENCYSAYKIFTQWTITRKKLKIVYIPENEEYFMDVVLTNVGKSEILPDGYMVCPVSFAGLTPWYKKNPLTFPLAEAPTVNYKQYSYSYPYMYALATQPNTVEFTNNGHYPACLYLDAQGGLSAPILMMENSATGEIYGMISLPDVSINEGERLIYSTLEDNPGVWKQTGNTLVDLIDETELNAGVPIFMTAAPQVPLKITLKSSIPISNPAFLYVYEFYKTR